MHRFHKPADERFPFGHGKKIYFLSFVVALIIFSLGPAFQFMEDGSHSASFCHANPSNQLFSDQFCIIVRRRHVDTL